MIIIEQRSAKKSVGNTSVYVSFSFSPQIVSCLKQVGDYNYNQDTHEWEFPLNKLSKLIDVLCFEDDLRLIFLPDVDRPVRSLLVKHNIQPFDYQREGINWLINNDNGLLLDSMGLGKSIQIIYAAEELKLQAGIEHCLVICGINTLKQNWKKEIQKFSNEKCVVIGEKVNSKGNVYYTTIDDRARQLYNPIEEFFVIINIESLRDNTIIDAIRSGKNKFDMIVVDECHKAKSVTSQQGKNLLKLATVGKYHYALSGTPLVNSPLDAYCPLKFIGQEKTTLTNFKSFYCVISTRFGHYQIDGFKNLDILKNEIDQCSLRRTKDILDLPPKIIIPEYVEMSSSQYSFYNDIQKGVVEEADKVKINTESLLGLVTRLREAATTPDTLTSKDVGNIKVEHTVELVEDIVANGEKVVIFSTFKEPLNKLKELLSDYNPMLCTGDVSDQEISESIDKFQNNCEYKVMLGTTSKMSTGITLTAASYVIFIDAPWTCAEFDQACDRCHRIGTKKSVTIYNLIAIGTIDERIQQLLDQKKGISDYMIDNKNTMAENLKILLGLTEFTSWQ